MNLRDSRLTSHLGCLTNWVHLKREQRPDPAILPKKQPPATERLVKYAGAAAVVRAGAPRAAGRDRRPGRDQAVTPLRCPEAVGCRAPNRFRAKAASRGSLPGKKLVFQQRAAIPRVRMAGFWHEPLETVRRIRSAKRGVTAGSTPWSPAFHTNYPTMTTQRRAGQAFSSWCRI